MKKLFLFLGIIFFLILYYLNNQTSDLFDKLCESSPTKFLEQKEPENMNTEAYDPDVSRFLLEISINTSISSCDNNYTPPPGYSLVLNLIDYKNRNIGKIIKNEKCMIIVFSGTMNKSEAWDDLIAYQVPTRLGKNTYNIHRGFSAIYRSIRGQIILNTDSSIPIFITGHSLGGALSTLCALDLSELNPIHYSFASPRVGDANFAQDFKVVKSFRIFNTEDMVPTLPPSTLYSLKYEHVGMPLAFTLNLGGKIANHIKAYVQFSAINSLYLNA